ncbi:hypothetical protein VTI74DRAFT_3439 [Chaetomium olivicolor]
MARESGNRPRSLLGTAQGGWGEGEPSCWKGSSAAALEIDTILRTQGFVTKEPMADGSAPPAVPHPCRTFPMSTKESIKRSWLVIVAGTEPQVSTTLIVFHFTLYNLVILVFLFGLHRLDHAQAGEVSQLLTRFSVTFPRLEENARSPHQPGCRPGCWSSLTNRIKSGSGQIRGPKHPMSHYVPFENGRSDRIGPCTLGGIFLLQASDAFSTGGKKSEEIQVGSVDGKAAIGKFTLPPLPHNPAVDAAPGQPKMASSPRLT